MSALIVGLALAATSPNPADVTLRTSAVVRHREVRLEDLADLSHLPLSVRASAASVVVARMGPHQTALVISVERVAERVRAQAPALTPWFPTSRAGSISVKLAGATTAVGQISGEKKGCVRFVRSLPAFSVVGRRDVTPADCIGSSANAVRYDAAAGALRTVRSIAAGDIATAPPIALLRDIGVGDRLHLRVKIGRVTVERDVEALQAGRSGGRIFVQTAEGQVFADVVYQEAE